MKKMLLRVLCLSLLLALCLPLVACDMQFGGLIGRIIERLPSISDDQMDQIEDILTEEDILPGIPVPDYTTPDYTYDFPDTTAPNYTEPNYTQAPETDTQPPYETEEPTVDDIPPMPNPVLISSIDEGYTMIGQSRNDQFFVPGQFMQWDKVAKIDDYTVESIGFFGWAAFTSEDIGVFGYQIDEQEPVFDTAFWFETEEPVWQAALSIGAKSASRMSFVIPVRDLSGEHTIRLLAKDQVGTIDIMGEVTIIKAEDPNAPVLMLNAYDIEQATLNSWGHQIASATVDATGSYVTLDATGSDPDNPGIIDPYLNLLLSNRAPYAYGARYLAIKYRTNGDSTGGNVFVGSGNGPTGNGDMIQFEYIEDGKWHLLVLDLATADAVDDMFNIGYLRYDIYHNILDTMDIGYFALFRSEEAALAYDQQLGYIDIYHVPVETWTVSGHAPQVTPATDPSLGAMVAAGGVEYGALLHQGSVGLGEIDLSQFSKMIVYYGTDCSEVTQGHHDNNPNNRIMITSSDNAMVNTPDESTIVAYTDYTLPGWNIVPIEIDLTNIDYNGPVYVTYDTLPGTFLLIGRIELVYED